MLVQLQRLEEKFSPELERRDTTTVATVEAEPIIPFGPELAGPTFATSALRLELIAPVCWAYVCSVSRRSSLLISSVAPSGVV